MPFEGVYAAIVCPMHENGRIDEAALAAHAGALARTPGLRGLLCNGHAGENHVLDPTEKYDVMAACRHAAPDAQLIAGLNAETPDAIAGEARDAERAGCDAAMVFPPFSWALGHDTAMAVAHHRAVLQATHLPLFLYQASIGAGRMAYTDATLSDLLQLPRIAGVKEGSWEFGAYESTRALAARVAPSVPVMASGDEHLLACFAAGTRGSIVSLASLVPEAIVALFDAAARGDLATARILHSPIQQLARLIYGGAAGAAQPTLRLKLALRQAGAIPSAGMRAPVAAPPEQLDTDISNAMAALREAERQIARAPDPADPAARPSAPAATRNHQTGPQQGETP